MKNKKRLNYASLIGVASVLACVAQAQDTVVTNNWNVTPWNVTGPTLQTFESIPAWANPAEQSLTLTDGPARNYYRFWTNSVSVGKAMSFATLGITNTFSGAKIQPGTPIFIDMRCKLNPFDSSTLPGVESNTVLCFYTNEKSNLVVATGNPFQCKTNANFTVDPGTYYPIMIRFASDKFDVFFNTTNEPTLFLSATTNQISKMVISGAGEMDDLYVSYGDPFRSSTNSSAQLNGWTPTNAEESVIANWLANKTTSGSYAKSDAEKFYLTDALPAGNTFDGDLGIGSFSYNPNTLKVTVVVTLKTGAASSTKKDGKINGVLQLKGAVSYEAAKAGGANWIDIAAQEKVGADHFAGGVATYTFTLPNDTYKFFLPVIKSNIK